MPDPASTPPSPKPPALPEHDLRAAGFEDLARAERNFAQLGKDPSCGVLLSSMLPPLLASLGNCPDPDMALNNFEAYADKVLNPKFLYSFLLESPRVLDLAIAIFSHSQFLTDILLRHPQYLYWLLEPGQLRRAKLKEEMMEELDAQVESRSSLEEKVRALRLFNRREILRIGVADILGNLDLIDVTQQLSFLAEITLQKAFQVSQAQLVRKHGMPRFLDPDAVSRRVLLRHPGPRKIGRRRAQLQLRHRHHLSLFGGGGNASALSRDPQGG